MEKVKEIQLLEELDQVVPISSGDFRKDLELFSSSYHSRISENPEIHLQWVKWVNKDFNSYAFRKRQGLILKKIKRLFMKNRDEFRVPYRYAFNNESCILQDIIFKSFLGPIYFSILTEKLGISKDKFSPTVHVDQFLHGHSKV